MVFLVTALLAGASVLPQIDRRSLELQARAEALQPRTHATRPTTAAPAPVRRPVVRRASAGAPLDLVQITTICRAAGNQGDPAAFLARLSSAYSLSSDDSTSLRSSCAAYLAGRADARR
jgi:hypothetical protein